MIETRIHTRAALATLLPDDEQLSPLGGASDDATPADGLVDFAAMLQGLYASNPPTAPTLSGLTTSPSSDSAHDDTSARKTITKLPLPAPAKPLNQAWASILPSDAIRPIAAPPFSTTESVEAANSYRLSNHSYELQAKQTSASLEFTATSDRLVPLNPAQPVPVATDDSNSSVRSPGLIGQSQDPAALHLGKMPGQTIPSATEASVVFRKLEALTSSLTDSTRSTGSYGEELIAFGTTLSGSTPASTPKGSASTNHSALMPDGIRAAITSQLQVQVSHDSATDHNQNISPPARTQPKQERNRSGVPLSMQSAEVDGLSVGSAAAPTVSSVLFEAPHSVASEQNMALVADPSTEISVFQSRVTKAASVPDPEIDPRGSTVTVTTFRLANVPGFASSTESLPAAGENDIQRPDTGAKRPIAVVYTKTSALLASESGDLSLDNVFSAAPAQVSGAAHPIDSRWISSPSTLSHEHASLDGSSPLVNSFYMTSDAIGMPKTGSKNPNSGGTASSRNPSTSSRPQVPATSPITSFEHEPFESPGYDFKGSSSNPATSAASATGRNSISYSAATVDTVIKQGKIPAVSENRAQIDSPSDIAEAAGQARILGSAPTPMATQGSPQAMPVDGLSSREFRKLAVSSGETIVSPKHSGNAPERISHTRLQDFQSLAWNRADKTGDAEPSRRYLHVLGKPQLKQPKTPDPPAHHTHHAESENPSLRISFIAGSAHPTIGKDVRSNPVRPQGSDRSRMEAGSSVPIASSSKKEVEARAMPTKETSVASPSLTSSGTGLDLTERGVTSRKTTASAQPGQDKPVFGASYRLAVVNADDGDENDVPASRKSFGPSPAQAPNDPKPRGDEDTIGTVHVSRPTTGGEPYDEFQPEPSGFSRRSSTSTGLPTDSSDGVTNSFSLPHSTETTRDAVSLSNGAFATADSVPDAIDAKAEDPASGPSDLPIASHLTSRSNATPFSQLRDEVSNEASTSRPAAAPESHTLSGAPSSDFAPPTLQFTGVPMIGQSKTAEQSNSANARPGSRLLTPRLNMASANSTASPEPMTTGHGIDPAPIRQLQGLGQQIETARVAELKVQLADGQTAHATVRERAGSIEVKIVTSTNGSAQRISGEIDTMRQNLDAAGLRLGHSEVSYQQGNKGGRNSQEYMREPQTNERGDNEETFTLSEVVE